MKKNFKIVVIFCLFMLTIIGCGKKSEYDIEKIKEINYTIEKTEENEQLKDNGSLYRREYTLSIVVDNEVSIEQLEEISKKIASDSKKELEWFNAITIFFTDYKEFVEVNNHILGKVTYAPEGDYSKSQDSTPGYYKNMDFKFELKEKDWDTRLTKEEAIIVKSCFIDFNYDSEATAKKFKISKDEVEKIIDKYNYWMIQS